MLFLDIIRQKCAFAVILRQIAAKIICQVSGVYPLYIIDLRFDSVFLFIFTRLRLIDKLAKLCICDLEACCRTVMCFG